MIAGMLPVIAGMALLSQVSPGTSYWTGVFPAMMLFGLGMGVVFVPLTTVSLAGVQARGIRRRLQHGQRHAAGSAVARPGGAGRGLRHREPQRRRAPGALGLSAVAQQHHVLVARHVGRVRRWLPSSTW